MFKKFNITGTVPCYLAVETYEHMAQVYGITEAEYNLWVTAYTNLNTEIGYDAFYALEQSILNRNGDQNILCDLGASFAWDGRLAVAMTQRQEVGVSAMQRATAELPSRYWEPGAEDAGSELPESEWVTEEPPFD